MGLEFSNPVGLAAGFDKHAEVPDDLLELGFGFVEVGSVTPRPQPGNPRPRVFRLEEDRAVINRYGFNSQGLAVAAERLRKRHGRSGIVGVNVGANKDSQDPVADYVEGVGELAGLASYFVINISSPNTPGLRTLQARDSLDALLDHVLAARRKGDAQNSAPLIVKIAPDLSPEDCHDIAEVLLARGVDGLIVSNTTTARPALRSDSRDEAGGLSGVPLLEPSTKILAEMYRLTEGKLPLIGTGGIASGHDAYRKIRAGASLVQLYTALVFQGPRLIGQIKQELADLLTTDGYDNIAQAVGADAANE
jgi:dihydroorotate dehydrogenase